MLVLWRACGRNIPPWSLFRTSFDLSGPEWGCRLCWVVWIDQLIAQGSLKSFTWIGNKFPQSSSSYRFFFFLFHLIIPLEPGQWKYQRLFKRAEKKKRKRNAHTALITSASDLSASLTHWTSFQSFEHETFWFPFVILSSSNCDSCCRQWLTRQCSFAQLNILMTKST